MSHRTGKQVTHSPLHSKVLNQNTNPSHSTYKKKLLMGFFCLSVVLLSLSLHALVQVTFTMQSVTQNDTETVSPCGKCQLPVTYDHKGLLCDTCNHWFHAPCQRVGDNLYDYLAKSDCSWHCTKCNSINHSRASARDLSSFSSENRFSSLSLNASPVNHNFIPQSTSTPSRNRPQRTNKTDSPLKIAHLNFRSMKDKKPQFLSFVEINKPDVIVGTETWLTPAIYDAGYFPPELGYTVYRRDRVDKKGGGVIILVNSTFISECKPEYQTNCENLWVQLHLAGSRSVLIGAYYKPQELDQQSFDEFSKSLVLVRKSNSTICLLGDFNLPKIDWETKTLKPDCPNFAFYRECLEAFEDCLLEQMVTSPTRGQNILDLFLTTNPTLVDKTSVLPGLSDHDIVMAEVNVRPQKLKQVPRNIYLYKKADWDQLKQSMRDFHKVVKSDLATADIQILWDKFVAKLQQGIDTFIPIRKARPKNGLPWINQEIRRLMRRRDKHYKRWTRSCRPIDQKKFLEYKHLVRRVSEMAYEKYIGDILGIQQEADDLDTPAKVNTKKLYSLLKHAKQDNGGITSLKANGKTFTSDADKANTLNNQFQSVFSPKSPTTLKAIAQKTLQDLQDSGKCIKQPFQPSPHTKMPDIQISSKGIECLLKKLNPHKASGPDQLKPIVLQTLHKELAPILQIIFKGPLIRENCLAYGKRQMCPLYSKRGTRPTQQTTVPYHLHVFYVKY